MDDHHNLELRIHNLDKSLFKAKDLSAVTPLLNYLHARGVTAELGDNMLLAAAHGRERDYQQAALRIPASNSKALTRVKKELALYAATKLQLQNLRVEAQPYENAFLDARYTLHTNGTSVQLDFARDIEEAARQLHARKDNYRDFLDL